MVCADAALLVGAAPSRGASTVLKSAWCRQPAGDTPRLERGGGRGTGYRARRPRHRGAVARSSRSYREEGINESCAAQARHGCASRTGASRTGAVAKPGSPSNDEIQRALLYKMSSRWYWKRAKGAGEGEVAVREENNGLPIVVQVGYKVSLLAFPGIIME